MPARKDKIIEQAVEVKDEADVSRRAPKLPTPLRFPLVAILSISLSSLLYSVAAKYTAGNLASVSRNLNEPWQVGVLVGWRIFELGLGWFGNLDAYDLTSLSLLSHGPPLYLLSTFYNIPATTAVSSLLIDILTIYLPFRLLRPVSAAHSSSRLAPKGELTSDFSIQIYTTILAAGIYAVVLSLAYVSYLPVYLVTYFNNIPSVAAAHSATLVTLFPTTLALGLAIRSFIFTPSAAVLPDEDVEFDPAIATFWETLMWNVWGHSSRTKLVIKRTATLMALCGVNTFVQTFVTVEGVEWQGAVAYSAVWVAAAGVAGAVLGVVGAV